MSILNRRIALLLLPLGLGIFVATNFIPAQPRAFNGSGTSQMMAMTGEIVGGEGLAVETDQPGWALLPGLRQRWERERAGIDGRHYPPLPTDDATFSVTEYDDGRQLTISYPDGGIYDAVARPALGSNAGDQPYPVGFISYRGPEPHSNGKLINQALRFLSYAVMGLGVVATVRQLAVAQRRAENLVPAGVGRELAERWLSRSRYFRLVGGLLGAVAYFGSATSGFFLDIMAFWSLGGVAFGGALAELHLLKRRGSAAVPAAEMRVRSLRDFTTSADIAAMTVVGVAALAVLVAQVAGWLSASVDQVLLSIGSIGAAALLQRLVVLRRRPALDIELREADDVIRALALTRGFVRPATAFALIALGTAFLDTVRGVNWVALALILFGVVWFATGSERRMPQLLRAVGVA